MSQETLVIASRFCGPPESGNGGYVCGCLAAYIAGSATVRLNAPPPLETELGLARSESAVRLLDDDRIIAQARPAALDLTPPDAPSFAEAEQAAKGYAGLVWHPFPRCFVCGTERAVGDGLRIFPGPVASANGLVATPWTPHESLADDTGRVGEEYLWGVLDCASGWSMLPLSDGLALVLGELCARVDGGVEANEKCVAIGWRLQIDGRKHFAGSAVFAGDGRPVALGRATWIEVQASTFGGV